MTAFLRSFIAAMHRNSISFLGRWLADTFALRTAGPHQGAVWLVNVSDLTGEQALSLHVTNVSLD